MKAITEADIKAAISGLGEGEIDLILQWPEATARERDAIMHDAVVYTMLTEYEAISGIDLADIPTDYFEQAGVVKDLETLHPLDFWFTHWDAFKDAMADEFGCHRCQGTGIGMHGDPSSSRCSACGGRG